MAKPASALVKQDIYSLVVDAAGLEYHLEGCIHAPKDSMHITLAQAARQGIAPDELCNPPRYDSRN